MQTLPSLIVNFIFILVDIPKLFPYNTLRLKFLYIKEPL